jgi:predicted DNA-binding transcriptional regulator AlpA
MHLPDESKTSSSGPINPARLAAIERRGKPTALLTAAQAAREVFGVSERTFHTLRLAPWMPRPVVCGPRILRWVRSELETAVLNMPRQAQPAAEPPQLRRHINQMKRGAA